MRKSRKHWGADLRPGQKSAKNYPWNQGLWKLGARLFLAPFLGYRSPKQSEIGFLNWLWGIDERTIRIYRVKTDFTYSGLETLGPKHVMGANPKGIVKAGIKIFTRRVEGKMLDVDVDKTNEDGTTSNHVYRMNMDEFDRVIRPNLNNKYLE